MGPRKPKWHLASSKNAIFKDTAGIKESVSSKTALFEDTAGKDAHVHQKAGDALPLKVDLARRLDRTFTGSPVYQSGGLRASDLRNCLCPAFW